MQHLPHSRFMVDISGAILREEKWIQQAAALKVNLFESDFPKLHRDFVESLR